MYLEVLILARTNIFSTFFQKNLSFDRSNLSKKETTKVQLFIIHLAMRKKNLNFNKLKTCIKNIFKVIGSLCPHVDTYIFEIFRNDSFMWNFIIFIYLWNTKDNIILKKLHTSFKRLFCVKQIKKYVLNSHLICLIVTRLSAIHHLGVMKLSGLLCIKHL